MTRKYQKTMRRLALPMVVVCAWRSVFPNLYAERITWYDSWVCSILVARMLATIAEVCWVAQVALALAFVERQLQLHPGASADLTCTCWSKLTRTAAVAMVLCIIIAELCSDYATITGDRIGFFLEEALWGVTFTMAFPVLLRLAMAVHKLPNAERKGGCGNASVYAKIAAAASFFYIVWQWTFHVPPLHAAWQQQQQDGDVFSDFGQGFVNALEDRNCSHDYNDWSGSLVWLSGYFTLCVWSSIALVCSPRIASMEPSSTPINTSGSECAYC